jgi:hypothetical protein
MSKKFFVIAVFLCAAAGTFAQEAAAASGTLPTSFRSFTLGMGIDELKTNLTADTYFVFRGDRDVSFLPLTKQNLVESEGSQFI